jgi:hypothetical protein
MDRLKLSLLTLLSTPCLCFATPQFGVTGSYVVLPKDPTSLRGYQLMFSYDPAKFQWRTFNIYFDAGVSYFRVTNDTPYPDMTIFSAAPVIRYTFIPRGPVKPYLDISIGVGYLSNTKFDDRNLGMRFTFQDRLGIGILFGKCDQFSLGFHGVHYSNAGLAPNNSGITIPIVVDFGYRF